MPIVNRANYSTCPSCNRWMHAPLQVLDGNRAMICQECYERADGVKHDTINRMMQDSLRDGLGMLSVKYVDPREAQSVTPPARAKIEMPCKSELAVIYSKWVNLGFRSSPAMEAAIKCFVDFHNFKASP